MAILDLSVRQAVAAAKRAGGALSYGEVQWIIRSVFDYGQITVQERDDLREVLRTMPMDGRATRALTNFLTHVDNRLAPALARAAATGDRNQGVPIKVPDPGPFAEYDTDLGKLIVGNFDARYDPGEGELIIGLRVRYEFEKGITPTMQEVVRWKMRKAVEAWDNAQATLESRMFVLNPVIRIRFKLFEVSGTAANKKIHVAEGNVREKVMRAVTLSQHTSIQVIIHELGHVYGNYDEYKGSGFMGWLERRMFWHDNRFLSDTDAVMNGDGTEFRTRYFDHMQAFVNKHFAKVAAWYRVVLPV
jgi:hypothetical protein